MAVGLVNKFVFPKSNGDGLCVACGEIEFVIDVPRGVTVPFRDVLNRRPFPVWVKGQFPVVRSPFRSGRVGLVVKLVLVVPYTEGVTGLFVGREAVASKFVRCLLSVGLEIRESIVRILTVSIESYFLLVCFLMIRIYFMVNFLNI